MKLFTGKLGVSVASEVLECFGGAGYVEDTGLPTLLRDAQVLPIWEGTTNVLSLETLRALVREDAWDLVVASVRQTGEGVSDPELAALGEVAAAAAERAVAWARATGAQSRPELEAGARRFAMTIARSFALAQTVTHAEWCRTTGGSRRALCAARRFASHGIDYLDQNRLGVDDTRLLGLGG